MKKIISLSFLFALFVNQANASLTEIEPGFGGSSTYNSEAYGVSSDGSVIVGYGRNSSNQTASKYSGGSFTDLGVLFGATGTSYANAVSGDGSVIVGGSDSHAFKYSSSGGFVDLGVLGTGTFSTANDVSSDGSVIVGYSATSGISGENAFKYTTSGGMVNLGTLSSGNYSQARAVSGDGSVIVGYSNLSSGASTYHAFSYTDGGGMVDLGTLGGTSSYAYDASNDGSVIIGKSQISGDSANHAAKYVSGAWTDLGTLGGTNSAAYAISSDGTIIVGESDTSSGVSHAIKYTTSGGMVDLGTLGGDNSAAYGISADGTVIVGSSQTSDGVYHAFMYKNSVSNSSLVDINNTYSALYENGQSLNAILNLKTALVRSSLNQDCNKFGANGFCVGIGYRYSNVDHKSMQQQAANLRIGYRFNENFRAGLIFDQTLDTNDPTNFTTQNKTPMSGFFLNFSEREDGSGFGARVAALYSRSSVDIKRSVLSNTEAGAGQARIKTTGMLAEVSYGQKFSEKLMIKPFAALRKTTVSRSKYTEVQGASFPISYNALEQNFTTAVLGFRSLLKLNKATALTFEFGTESALHGKVDGYSGNISSLGNFSLNAPNVRSQTNYFDIGAYHDLANNQRVSVNFSYGSQNLNSAKVGMVYVGYYLGF